MEDEFKDAERVSAYLKGDDLLLLKAIKEECNHTRRVTCDNHYKTRGFVKRYKPIGNSEVIRQLLIRYRETSKRSFVDKLEFHSRQAEYYKDRLVQINSTKKEHLIENVRG